MYGNVDGLVSRDTSSCFSIQVYRASVAHVYSVKGFLKQQLVY